MRLRLLIHVILVAAIGLALPSAAMAEALVVRDVSMAEYPRVSAEVLVPTAGTQAVSAPKFVVTENDRPTQVSVAARPQAAPVDVVLAIDTSGSMKGRSIDSAKRAAAEFVNGLQPGSKAAIVSFADKAHVVAPFTGNKAVLGAAIDHLGASGETALYDSLARSATIADKSDSKSPIVVLLSDGGDTVSRASANEALGRLKAAGIPVLVVALPSAESDYAALKAVATQTGGRFATVGRAEDLVTFYAGLAHELQSGWRVTYISNRPATKDLDVVVRARVGNRNVSGSVVLPNPAFTVAERGRTLKPLSAPDLLSFAVAIGLVFGAVAVFTILIAVILTRPKTGLDQLRFYDQLRAQSDSTDSPGSATDRVTASVVGAVDFVAGKRGIKRYVHEQLERAGLPLRPTEYMTLHMLIVILVGVLTVTLGGGLGLSMLLVLLATVLPMMWVSSRISDRRRKFEDMLPDVLNMIAGSLRAGWGLQQAIDGVVDQAQPPVSTEFKRAQTEIRLGRTPEEALSSVAERLSSADFKWAVTAISIQREVGGNLAEVLDIVAATIRDRAALNRQIRGLTAEGRLSAYILLGLPLLLIGALSFLNPVYIAALFNTALGMGLLLVGAVLLIIGALWLRKVVEIEV